MDTYKKLIKMKKTWNTAISLRFLDHSKTATYGKSQQAEQHRTSLKEFMEKGDFKSAFEKSISSYENQFKNHQDWTRIKNGI